MLNPGYEPESMLQWQIKQKMSLIHGGYHLLEELDINMRSYIIKHCDDFYEVH